MSEHIATEARAGAGPGKAPEGNSGDDRGVAVPQGAARSGYRDAATRQAAGKLPATTGDDATAHAPKPDGAAPHDPAAPKKNGPDGQAAMKRVEAGGMSLGMGIASFVGGALDAGISEENQRYELAVNVNCPVPAFMAVGGRAGIELQFKAERSSGDKFKVFGRVGLSASVNESTPIGQAFARASLFGYIESVGRDGTQAVMQIMTLMYEGLMAVNADVAHALFGGSSGNLLTGASETASPLESHTATGMREGTDYAEIGGGITASAGFGGEFKAGEKGAKSGASAKAELTQGMRLGRHGEGLGMQKTNGFSLQLQGDMEPFKMSLTGGVSVVDGKLAELKCEAYGQAMFDVTKLPQWALGANIVLGFAGLIGRAVQNASGFIHGDAATFVGSLVRNAKHASGAEAQMAAGCNSFVARKFQGKSTGAKVGVRLSLEYSSKPGGDTMKVRLEQVEEQKLATTEETQVADENKLLYVKSTSLMPIFVHTFNVGPSSIAAAGLS